MCHIICRLILICSLLLLAGCTSFSSLAEDLNARGDRACVAMQGAYGLFVSGRVLIATGGASLEECGTLLH